jgi:MoaA/NifB/PqqE/SkfB family radical SAM enzyme
VAGDDATHGDLRSGARLDELWGTVERLVARRGRRKSPRVKASYLLTRNNAEQVPRVVRAAARAGADEFFLIHLDCTPSPELLRLAAFDASGVDPSAADAIEEAGRVAKSCKIAFRAPALVRQRLLVCALNPLSFAFVSWDGKVGPCVNLALPVEGPIPRCSDDGPTQVERLVFGDLAENGLAEILEGEQFQSFARSFESRLAAERRFLEDVGGRSTLDALQYLDAAERRREEDLSANPFPAPCAGCHKAVGW